MCWVVMLLWQVRVKRLKSNTKFLPSFINFPFTRTLFRSQSSDFDPETAKESRL
jgi:hypothetical protein